MAFIVPGLVMMSVINNSFMNVVSSFFGNKFQRSIEELLVSPAPNWVIIGGYISGGVLRGLIVGGLVFVVSIFFTRPVIEHFWLIVVFILITSIVFALGGLTNGILAKKFDDISIFPTFILTPLIYLGGVFYSIHSLPEFWQTLSKLNPVLYMVDGFRYGFYGFSDVNVFVSFVILILFAVILSVFNWYLLRKGVGLKT
jgi:ABC-2 type transport system permease protein